MISVSSRRILVVVIGMIIAVIAGAAISLQTVFNNKVNEQTGSWTTTTLALGMGFIFAATATIMIEGRELGKLLEMDSWYWYGGVIGVGVVFCLVQAIKRLGPTFTISIVLVAQLGTALFWDSMGWLGLEKIPFSFMKLAGILLIISGVVVFSYRKSSTGNEPETQRSSSD